MTLCTCSLHCTRSGYHEKACCEGPLCECWCHDKAKEISRAALRAIDDWFDQHIEECEQCATSRNRFCDLAESKLAAEQTILQEEPADGE